MIGNWDFLTSRRFWALVLIAIIKVLESETIIPVFIGDPIIQVLLGFTVIGTVDKVAKAIVAIK
jgi:hypothetical protein